MSVTNPIVVLYGGRGAEHDISCRSAAYLLSLLKEMNLPHLGVQIRRNGAWYFDGTDTPTFPVRLVGKRGFWKDGSILPVRCVFPVLHGDHGEDGEVQGLLEAAGIPYLGCDHTAGVLTSDKAVTKILAESIGIPTAPFCCSEEENPFSAKAAAEEKLSYPLFLKPTSLGSSIGAGAVNAPEEFDRVYREARKYGRVLIEEKMPIARELELAYLGGTPPNFAGPGSVFCQNTFYSFAEKYQSNSGAALEDSPDLPKSVIALCKGYSAGLVSLFKLRHLSRIDFFLLRDGRVILNEINPFPGFTDISLYPKLWKAAGLSPSDLINRFLALAEGDAAE